MSYSPLRALASVFSFENAGSGSSNGAAAHVYWLGKSSGAHDDPSAWICHRHGRASRSRAAKERDAVEAVVEGIHIFSCVCMASLPHRSWPIDAEYFPCFIGGGYVPAQIFCDSDNSLDKILVGRKLFLGIIVVY